jgi:hypothetical protein
VKRWGWIALGLYLVLIIAALAALPFARNRAIANMGSASQRQAWQRWRDEVQRQGDAGGGAVERRVPRSPEPPTLVLLRDHFASCMVGGFVLTTLLYWSTALFIRGALFGPKFQVDFGDKKLDR